MKHDELEAVPQSFTDRHKYLDLLQQEQLWQVQPRSLNRIRCKRVYHTFNYQDEWQSFQISGDRTFSAINQVFFLSENLIRGEMKGNSSWLNLPSYLQILNGLFIKRC